ncbi:MAG TPA: CDP-alcohol phosphatidyltransferase family protein [Aestuariivirga sp.]|nr:CDP-alcohol phosphatidyltransferase family protein [Aestuariivirga sp.]
MIDRYALAILKPAAEHAARRLAARGLSADQVSLAGFAIGLLAALTIALGFPAPAIVPLLLNRALDGIDGAMARLSQATDRGAFIDIGLDFLFYAAIPLGFAFADPGANALAAAVLLAAFVGTGTSFLAYAVIAEKRGLKSEAYPTKSFYYLGGLTEGAETIVAFLAMCWWPQYFSGIAYVYAAMCTVTTVTRLLAGWQAFGGDARS